MQIILCSQIVNVQRQHCVTTCNVLLILSLCWHGPLQSLSPNSQSESSARYSGESPGVSDDCLLNLSGSTVKLISLIISNAVRKGYKSPPPASIHYLHINPSGARGFFHKALF